MKSSKSIKNKLHQISRKYKKSKKHISSVKNKMGLFIKNKKSIKKLKTKLNKKLKSRRKRKKTKKFSKKEEFDRYKHNNPALSSSSLALGLA
jgi:hypothetical protein